MFIDQKSKADKVVYRRERGRQREKDEGRETEKECG